MRMLRRNALSFLTCMPIAAAAGGTSAAAVPEEKPKTSGKILFVITSHGELGNTGKKTGYWLSLRSDTSLESIEGRRVRN